MSQASVVVLTKDGEVVCEIPDRPLPRVTRVEYMRKVLKIMRLTRDELVGMFHISEATLYRDMALLRSEPFYDNIVSAMVWFLPPVGESATRNN